MLRSLIVFVLLLPTAGLPASHAELEIAATPDGGPTRQVAVDLAKGATGGGAVFWLRNAGDNPLPGVTLDTDFTGKPTVELTLKGAADGAVEVGGTPVRVDVAVTQVASAGSYSGRILASQGGSIRVLGELTIRRPGSLTLEGVGVQADKITATTDQPELLQLLYLTSDDPEARTATLVLRQLIGPNGEPAKTSLELSGQAQEVEGSYRVEITVPPHGSVPIELSADLTATGAYSGSVRVMRPDGGTELSLPIAVTRTASATAAFEVSPLANARGRDLGLLEATRAELIVTVAESNRGELEIDQVELMTLDLVEGESRRMAERGGISVWIQPEPEPRRPGGEANDRPWLAFLYRLFGAAAEETRDAERVTSWPITVPRNQAETLRVRIDGLTESGQYGGTLRMISGNWKPVSLTFTVFVRRHWSLAFSAILLGVAAAALLRWLGGRRRVYAIQSQLAEIHGWLSQIESDGEDLKAPLRRRLSDVANGVRRQIDRLSATVRRDPAADLKDELDGVREKVQGPLRDWLDLLRKADRWGLLAEVDKDLLEVEAYLSDWSAEVSDLAAAETKLAAARDKLGARDVAYLKSLIEAQIEAVEAQRGALPHGSVDPVLERLRAAIAQADGDAARARAELEAAWRQWMDLFVQQVVANLPPLAPPPLGFADSAAWKAVRDVAESRFGEVQVAADLATAREAYRSALEELLEKLLAAFEAGLSEARTGLGASGRAQTAKETFEAAIDVAQEELGKARGQLRAGRLENARVTYDHAATAFTLARDAFEAAPAAAVKAATYFKSHTKAAGPVVRLDAAGPGIARAVPAERPSDRALPSSHWLVRVRRSPNLAGFLWTVAAGGVVGLLGLEVLYLDSSGWGTLRDFIVAVLWGLGLHSGAAVTTAAVNRFSSVPGSV